MKVLGVQTSDFSAYYDLVQVLKARGVAFVTVAPGETAPPHVGVLVTTAAEAPYATHPNIVVFTQPERTLEEAMRALQGRGPYRRCVIGIDPGERPGIAILADGRVLRLVHASAPEAVRAAVEDALTRVEAARFVVRIGNGAPTFRDRILHTLGGLDAQFEVVDERHSTPVGYHGNAGRDTAAATSIALTPGAALVWSHVRPIRPTEGELRDIQRKSRLASEGSITISRSLARNVAMGRLTLAEAVDRQMGRV